MVDQDQRNYPEDFGTLTADILLVIILFNNIVSIPGVKIMSIHIKNFYLDTPLKC